MCNQNKITLRPVNTRYYCATCTDNKAQCYRTFFQNECIYIMHACFFLYETHLSLNEVPVFQEDIQNTYSLTRLQNLSALKDICSVIAHITD